MASHSKSFTLLDTPERIWSILADFPRWNRIFYMPDARKRGWGDRFHVKDKAAQGGTLYMMNEETEVWHEWAIEEFVPPRRLKLSTRRCFSRIPAKHVKAAIELTVTPVSAGETKVDVRLDAELSDPFWSFFTFWIPLKGILRKVVDNMEQGLARALSE